MILGTVVAVFIQLPITICHFFRLKPSQIQNMYPELYKEEGAKSIFIYYNRIMTCSRLYWPGTIDLHLITYYILAINLIAIALVIMSYVVILLVLVQSRKKFAKNTSESKRRIKAQNYKIAKAALLMTSCTMLPWLPNIILRILFEFSSIRVFI